MESDTEDANRQSILETIYSHALVIKIVQHIPTKLLEKWKRRRRRNGERGGGGKFLFFMGHFGQTIPPGIASFGSIFFYLSFSKFRAIGIHFHLKILKSSVEVRKSRNIYGPLIYENMQ